MTKCLIQVESTGVKTIGLTFDGTVSNFNMGEALGAKLKRLDNLQPYFFHPTTGNKIFIDLDACYMIKLVRNVMGSTHLIYEEDCKNCNNKENDCNKRAKIKHKQYISWKYIERLVEVQDAQGLLSRKFDVGTYIFTEEK